jgi:hypothetical protein
MISGHSRSPRSIRRTSRSNSRSSVGHSRFSKGHCRSSRIPGLYSSGSEEARIICRHPEKSSGLLQY